MRLPTAVPKPRPRTEAQKLAHRKAQLKKLQASRATIAKRGGRPRPVNRKRKASEFARSYGSRARVAFVKSLPCCYCTALSWIFATVAGRSDNAHTEHGGAGRKGPYTSIVPLCRNHHRWYDERRGPFAQADVRAAIADYAKQVEAAWQRFSGAGRGEDGA